MQIGDIIAARYRLEKKHQASWQAVRVDDGLICLLKPASCFVDPDMAAWLGLVWHPGLPRCRETITGNDRQTYHAFDYLPGRSLESLARETAGRIPQVQLLTLMVEVSGILSFLHQQNERTVIHLDVKPGNIIVAPDGSAGLIDFDAAVFDPANPEMDIGAERRNMRALTPEYAAPEQIAGHVSPSSDLYALGLTMLVLLTGLDPAACRSIPLAELVPEAGSRLQGLLGRCLNTDPLHRYSKADELMCDLNVELIRLRKEEEITMQQEPSGGLGQLQSQEQEQEQEQKQKQECGRDHRPLSMQDPDIGGDSAESDQNQKNETQSPIVQAVLPSSLICIWNGAEFGCEIAAVLAATRRVLLIDADLLNPRADLLLGICSGSDGFFHEDSAAGLDRAIREEQNGHLNTILLDHLAQPTRIAQLRLLATQGNLDYFEYYQLESLHQVFKVSRLIADLVLVLCNRSIFDSFTCLSLLEADRILIPLAADAGSFREINRAVTFMELRHQLCRDRLHYVAFPYNSRVDLGRGTMDELCCGHLTGCISDSSRRRSMKSSARPFAAFLDREIHREYMHLIQSIRLL